MTIPTYLLGDHHSNYDDLIRALLRRGMRGVRIIHVGDGEEGYPDSWDSETPEQLDNAFASLDIEYLSIRGNHSNPHVFDGSVNLPNFKLLPDYARLEIDSESWLFVGGAISIDRLNRIPNETWWPEEEMVLREELSAKADVLVTHTGPTSSVPPVSNFLLEYIHA
jgi:Calcineurin-like phosphoesterase